MNFNRKDIFSQITWLQNCYFWYLFYSLIQDQGLEVIAEGLDTLKNMAHDMNEVLLVQLFLFACAIESWTGIIFLFNYCQEVDRQVPLMDEIDDKVILL